MDTKGWMFRGLLLLAVAGGKTTDVVAQDVHSHLPAGRNGFVVIAHRGNHVRVPENTIASVEEGIRAGADYVEIDLRTTKDGYLVLSHDATVDRMTDGKGKVRDLTFEEIRKLKVGKDSTLYRIPTFREVLRVCKGRMNIYLDFKDADPAVAYGQIREAGMEGQVVVYLNKAAQYDRWKKVAPAMPLMSSMPEQIKTTVQFREFLDQAHVAVLDNVYDTALQVVAKEKGVALWLDVEGPDEGPALWDRALAWNVQGLQTDRPAALVDYLRQTGRRQK
jgi:glycerophosphoryl diester phosphodiesterase